MVLFTGSVSVLCALHVTLNHHRLVYFSQPGCFALWAVSLHVIIVVKYDLVLKSVSLSLLQIDVMKMVSIIGEHQQSRPLTSHTVTFSKDSNSCLIV